MCKLSIVMPVFNGHELLKVMLDSILNNTFQDWELILVDDGSEVETLSLIEQYRQSDSRILFLRRDASEAKGAPTCRNKGLDHARGEYLVFFDSDDYITPFCLQQRVEMMDSHPNADFLVFPSGHYVDGDMDDVINDTVFGYPVFADDISMFAMRILPFIVWNNIYRRRSIVDKGVRWDTNLKSLQDADFNLQCLLSGMNYEYIDAPSDYAYRNVTAASSVSTGIISDAHKASHLYAINKFYEMLQSRFGHQYDSQLYRGTLFIFNSVTRIRFDDHFAVQLCECVKKYDKKRGKAFMRKVRLCSFLRKILPGRRARQIAFFGFLRSYNKQMKTKAYDIRLLRAKKNQDNSKSKNVE